MKTFVVTTIIKVSNKCKEQKATKEMIQRLLTEKQKTGIIEKDCFRKKVVLDVKEIHSEVMEG